MNSTNCDKRHSHPQSGLDDFFRPACEDVECLKNTMSNLERRSGEVRFKNRQITAEFENVVDENNLLKKQIEYLEQKNKHLQYKFEKYADEAAVPYTCDSSDPCPICGELSHGGSGYVVLRYKEGRTDNNRFRGTICDYCFDQIQWIFDGYAVFEKGHFAKFYTDEKGGFRKPNPGENT